MIRKYTPSDLDGLTFLKNNVSEPSDRELVQSSIELLKLDDTSILGFVAECDGMITGFNVGIILPSKVLIPEGIYVDPEYRGKGISRALSEALEEASGCEVSKIYFREGLSQHYENQGYIIGNYKVAIKDLKSPL